MGMKEQEPLYTRPAMWGFFICIVLTAAIFVVRLFLPAIIQYRWDADRTEQRIRTQQVIYEAFRKKTEHLTGIIEQISRDPFFSTVVNFANNRSVLRAFHSLEQYRVTDDQTIDLVDSQGTVLAWSGPSIPSLYKQIGDLHAPESFVSIIQNGLRVYVTVGKKIAAGKFVLIVSEPLEVNSPISNRFVQKISFCEELSQTLKTQVTLKLPQSVHPAWE